MSEKEPSFTERILEPQIRGDLSIEDLVRLQINRTNMSATADDEELFQKNVTILKHMPAPDDERVSQRVHPDVPRHRVVSVIG